MKLKLSVYLSNDLRVAIVDVFDAKDGKLLCEIGPIDGIPLSFVRSDKHFKKEDGRKYEFIYHEDKRLEQLCEDHGRAVDICKILVNDFCPVLVLLPFINNQRKKSVVETANHKLLEHSNA